MFEDYLMMLMWYQVIKNLVDLNFDGWVENVEDNYWLCWLCLVVDVMGDEIVEQG